MNSTDSTVDDVPSTIEQSVIATIMCIWSACSLATSAAFTTAVLHSLELRSNPFFIGQLSLAACDALQQAAFLIIAAPSSYLGYVYSNLFNGPGSALLTEVPWLASTSMLAFQSLNRYVSICRPDRYDTIFGGQRIWIFILTSWILGFGIGFSTFFPCCYVLYFPEDYSFAYNTPELGSTIISYIDLCYSSTNVLTAQILNTLIFRNIYRRHRSIQARNESQFQKRQRKREIRLFAQLFIVATIVLLQYVTFIFLPLLSTSRFAGLGSSIIYLISTSANPFIFVLFNESVNSEVCSMLRKMLCWKVQPIAVTGAHQRSPNHSSRSQAVITATL